VEGYDWLQLGLAHYRVPS